MRTDVPFPSLMFIGIVGSGATIVDYDSRRRELSAPGLQAENAS
jgi:hypothetical protein